MLKAKNLEAGRAIDFSPGQMQMFSCGIGFSQNRISPGLALISKSHEGT
jgi:hypothetical protein